MLKQILTISMMLLGAFAWGQSFAVSGRVEDAKNHEAMPFTNVALLRTSDSVFMRGATTDDKGVYTIRDVSAGDYLLKVAFAGYDTYWQAVSISGDTELPLISLSTSAVMLEGVVVTAERPLFSMDGEKMMYNTAEDPTVQTGTAMDALQSMPDVMVDATGNITLRGVSGVEIWINDQPSHLDAEGLKQYLKTLPASAIERIEVITNPSARYSTSNGIINIVTNQKVVLNDFLSLTLGGTTRPDFAPWFTYVHSSDKMTLNIYGSPNYRHTASSRQGGYKMFDDNGQLTESQEEDRSADQIGKGFILGGQMTYQIDTASTLMAYLGLWGNRDQDSNVSHIDRIYHQLGDTLSFSHLYQRDNHYLGVSGGAVYMHLFDPQGQRLQSTLAFSMAKGNYNEGEHRTYLSGAPRSDYKYLNTNAFDNIFLISSLNYTKPFGDKMELETGLNYQLSYVTGFDSWDSTDLATGLTGRDPMRSFDMIWNAHETSLYGTLLRRFGGLTAKVGLSLEDKVQIIDMLSHPQYSFTRNFFNFVPSLHLTYRTEKNDNLKLNYTRRYDAPKGSQLNAFRNYTLESFHTGNPALLCSYTHNVEAGWTRFFPKFGSVSVEAYYKGNTDEIQELSDVAFDPFFGRYVQFTQPINMGNSHTLGATANVTYRPNAMLNIRLNASLFDNYYRAQFRDGQWDESEMLSYSLSLSAWAKVWKVLDVYCNAYYSSPTQSLLTTIGHRKSLDLGLSADLLDHRLSMSLAVRDLFDWNQQTTDINNPYYLSWSTDNILNSRQIAFSLTYRLGKLELERMAKQGQ